MKKILCIALVVASGLPGCGDNIKLEPDGSSPASDRATAFIVAGEFSSGVGIASRIGIPSLELTTNVVSGVVSSDPVLRHIDDRLYVINRLGHDNITILDADKARLITQISTGPGSNPQDVAVKGRVLYVAALASTGVLIIDLDDPTTIRTVDLSGLDPRDGRPDCSALALVGEQLFVTCGVLDGFAAVAPGKVAVIDTASNSVITTFDLATRNPFGYLYTTPANSMLGGDLLVATVDFSAGLTTGCLERIGVGSAPASKGCLVTNERLGGFASGFAYGPDDALYVAVTAGFDAMGTAARAIRYQVADDMLDETAVSGAGQRIFELAACPSGEWVFADATGGIRIYDAEFAELTTKLLDVGLPPVDDGIVCY